MSRVLVAYASNSGSTGEVAESIASELTRAGHRVEVSLISTVKDLTQFDSVVLGAPMIFGWQNTARRFLRRHREELTLKK